MSNKRWMKRKRQKEEGCTIIIVGPSGTMGGQDENAMLGKDPSKSGFMEVRNNGQELVYSSYWESEQAARGFFDMSINAGAFRLLVPTCREDAIKEMATGEYCIISKGPSLSPHHLFGLELLFEDHTDCPYSIQLCGGQVWPNPAAADAGKKFVLSVWTKGCKKVLEMDAYFRVVDRLPYLKPLGE